MGPLGWQRPALPDAGLGRAPTAIAPHRLARADPAAALGNGEPDARSSDAPGPVPAAVRGSGPADADARGVARGTTGAVHGAQEGVP
jgi:hypothetical protein